jgi:hypothetical protein
MKPHRFDPFSFVAGLALTAFGAMLLWGDLDMTDMRPSRLWPWPVLALGLMFTLYGARRLVESLRPPRAEPEIDALHGDTAGDLDHADGD